MRPAILEGFDLAYQEWSWWIWVLYAFAAYCSVGFIWFWFRLHGLARRIDAGDQEAQEDLAKAAQGFPNAVFAKMMGFGTGERSEPDPKA